MNTKKYINEYENLYFNWRKSQFNNKTPFFPIFKDFMPYLKTLTPGAVSLFIFLGLKSNNKLGTSFYKIETISKFFDRSPRTISNWIKDLEDAHLIIRKQKKVNSVSITYLLPYGNEFEIENKSNKFK